MKAEYSQCNVNMPKFELKDFQKCLADICFKIKNRTSQKFISYNLTDSIIHLVPSVPYDELAIKLTMMETQHYSRTNHKQEFPVPELSCRRV